MTFTKWDNADSSNKSCAILSHVTDTWSPVSCEETHKFVCKYNYGPKPTTPPPGDCPEGWEDINTDYCYMFVQGTYVSLISTGCPT